MIKVETITKCDLCGKKHTRIGAEGFTPPVEWASLNISIRHEGSGWTNHSSENWVICPECIKKFQEFVGKE